MENTENEEIVLSPAKVTVSVKLGIMDMYYFMLRHTYSSYSGWFGILISLGAFGMLLAGVAKGDQVKTILLIIMSLLFTIVNPLMLWWKSVQQVKLNPMFQKPISYGFGADGILVEQGEEKAPVLWDEVCKVIESGKYIIVYMSKVRAFVLPKKALAENTEAIRKILAESLDEKRYRRK